MIEQRVMLVAPHSDDELYGAGGALLKWRGLGSSVKLVLVCCSDVLLHHAGSVSRETRVNEFTSAAARLSDLEPTILGYPDQGLDSVMMSGLVSDLDRELVLFRPTLLLIPEPSYHQDHQYVHKACIASLRMTGRRLPGTVIEYEIPTSVSPGGTFTPNVYVDITETSEEKARIFRECYVSQHTDTERGALSAYGMNRHALYRGVEAGVQYAEAFRLVRMVK